MPLRVGILEIELLFHGSQSLKDKRRLLRGVKERMASRFSVSVAETDYQDKWQHAALGFVMAGSDTRQVNSSLQKMEESLLGDPRMEVIKHRREVI